MDSELIGLHVKVYWLSNYFLSLGVINNSRSPLTLFVVLLSTVSVAYS